MIDILDTVTPILPRVTWTSNALIGLTRVEDLLLTVLSKYFGCREGYWNFTSIDAAAG